MEGVLAIFEGLGLSAAGSYHNHRTTIFILIMATKRKSESFCKDLSLPCICVPEPLLSRFGWKSCLNCKLERLQPPSRRRYDTRICERRPQMNNNLNLFKFNVICSGNNGGNNECVQLDAGLLPEREPNSSVAELEPSNASVSSEPEPSNASVPSEHEEQFEVYRDEDSSSDDDEESSSDDGDRESISDFEDAGNNIDFEDAGNNVFYCSDEPRRSSRIASKLEAGPIDREVPFVSPDGNERHISNRQSAVIQKWWDGYKHRLENVEALEVKLRLCELNVESLEREKKELENENKHLKAQLLSARLKVASSGNEASRTEVDANGTVGQQQWRFSKLYCRAEILVTIGTTLISLLDVVMRKTHQITRLRVVSDVLFKEEIFGSMATNEVVKDISKSYAQKYIFLPWKILRALDLSINGGINYNGVKALRTIEGLQPYERGIIPSRATIQKCSAQLHEYAQSILPIKQKNSIHGELFEFDYEMMLRYLLRTFSLYDKAQQERVELCITLDGTELCKDLSHLSFGVKITDSRAVDPWDGMPLCQAQDGLLGNLFKMQSCNYCFIMKNLLGKDSKEAYQEFADVFKFFENVMKEGLPASALGPAIMPIIIWSPQDLSSIWKSLGTGSGAKKKGDTHWCHLCACTGDGIASFTVEENRYVFSLLVNRSVTFYYFMLNILCILLLLQLSMVQRQESGALLPLESRR
jgi:hypothetical protein